MPIRVEATELVGRRELERGPMLSGLPLQSRAVWEELLDGDRSSSFPAGLALNHVRYFATGSSRRSLPSSRSCMIAIAVNSLLCEAMRNFVVGVICSFALVSANPKPLPQTSS